MDKELVDAIKETVYSHIIEYLDIEGYLSAANPYFTKAKVSHLVYSVISPILSGFRRKTKRLEREKEIVSIDIDCKTGGREGGIWITLR